MSKQEKSSRSGFVIKLSNETAQKLAEEDQQAKAKSNDINESTVSARDKSENTKSKPNEISQEAITSFEVTNVASTNKIETSESKDGMDLVSVTNESDSKIEPDKSEDNAEANAWGEYAPYITYEGEEAIYTDPTNKQRYTWSQTTNSWETKAGNEEVVGRVYSYENDTHVYTESDGSKFFYDAEKKAWIPKVDDDFLAYYQMSYGFVDNKTEDKKDEKEKEDDKKKASNVAGVKRKTEPQWFQPPEETNTKVYVSNLPLDITEEEFVELMQKCGLVERDVSSQKMKIKLYLDKEQNCFKGDALCTYIKIESVDLALKLLDGSDFKGNKIKVERAHFQQKGEYNPALKPKKKKKKELEKMKKMQQKLFDWRPEKFVGERSKHERVVIVKNLFHPKDFDDDVQLILDYQQDLREECSKSGEVRKVVIYDRHPEGVAQITMKEPEQADAVIQLISGRWFGKRQITAEIWDGRTKYRIAETVADIKGRIEKWDNFLEDKEEGTGNTKPEGTNVEKSNKTPKDSKDEDQTAETEVSAETKMSTN